MKIGKDEVAIFPFSKIVVVNTRFPYSLPSQKVFECSNSVLKKVLPFLFPPVINYYSRELRWGIDDYPYHDEDAHLESYTILNTSLTHYDDRIEVSFPLTDMIIGVELSEIKHDILDESYHNNPQIFYNNFNITHFSKLQKFEFLYNLGLEKVTLTIRGSKETTIEELKNSKFSLEDIANHCNWLKKRRNSWKNESGLIVYPIFNDKLNNHHLNIILRRTRWSPPLFFYE